MRTFCVVYWDIELGWTMQGDKEMRFQAGFLSRLMPMRAVFRARRLAQLDSWETMPEFASVVARLRDIEVSFIYVVLYRHTLTLLIIY